MLIPSDKRTREVIRKIGNSIHPLIQLEVDYPSNKGKMPLLDPKVWIHEIDSLHRTVHEFYAKDVSSMTVIFAKSPLS